MAKKMTRKEYREALMDMKKAGEEMMEERGGEFSFGEWAGESQSEILEYVTGWHEDDFTVDELDELYNAYLGY